MPTFEPQPQNGNAELMLQCTVTGEVATFQHRVQWFVGDENVGETRMDAGATRSRLNANTITVQLISQTVSMGCHTPGL